MLAVLAFGFGISCFGMDHYSFGGIAVSFARVALGVHLLIDIIVGWIIGVLLGTIMLDYIHSSLILLPFVF